MKAVATRTGTFRHDIVVREHLLAADEPEDSGGEDRGPSPQELLAAALASCTAITMEMYAKRKGWDVSGLEVDCEYSPAERGAPVRFEMVFRMPSHLSEDQVERLKVIAAKCPVHRTLEGEVMFEESVKLA